jgi:hypothetical protein
MTICEVESPPAQPIDGEDGSGRSWLRSRWFQPCAFTVLGVLLFFAYLTEASRLPIFADGSSQALQASDMLHGNLLLHGWVLSDVSFYTTEIPQYMLIELVRGLNPDVVHIAAAMTYALLVVLSAVLAKGKATGREALVRVLIVVGIMLAPAFGRILHARTYSAAWILLSAPDHTGTQVPLVLLWLMLDRLGWPGPWAGGVAGGTPRNPPLGHEKLRRAWWLPVAVLVLLAWVEIADSTAIYEGALPIAIVCLVRVYRRREALSKRWLDLSLAAAALASVGFAMAALNVIKSIGGFVVNPARPELITISGMTASFWLKVHSLLVLFGADFFGISAKNAIVPFAHLIAVALVVWGVARAVRLVFRADDLAVLAKRDDPLTTPAMQVLTMSFLVLLVAFIFGFRSGARETVGLLPLGAVLAGRMLATRVFEVRLVPILAAVLAFYGLSLARYDSEPALPSADRPLASWLLAHHLTYGMSTSWFGSNGVTLFAHDRVKAIDVRFAHNGKLVRLRWNTKASWYSPRLHDATFVVTNPCSSAIPVRLYTTVGPPSATYYIDGFSVLVWRHTNLLARHPVLEAGTGRQGGQPGTRHHRHRNYASYQLMCG